MWDSVEETCAESPARTPGPRAERGTWRDRRAAQLPPFPGARCAVLLGSKSRRLDPSDSPLALTGRVFPEHSIGLTSAAAPASPTAGAPRALLPERPVTPSPPLSARSPLSWEPGRSRLPRGLGPSTQREIFVQSRETELSLSVPGPGRGEIPSWASGLLLHRDHLWNKRTSSRSQAPVWCREAAKGPFPSARLGRTPGGKAGRAEMGVGAAWGCFFSIFRSRCGKFQFRHENGALGGAMEKCRLDQRT